MGVETVGDVLVRFRRVLAFLRAHDADTELLTAVVVPAGYYLALTEETDMVMRDRVAMRANELIGKMFSAEGDNG